MKILYIIPLLLLISLIKKEDSNWIKLEEKRENTTKHKKLKDYMSETIDYIWQPNHSENSPYISEIIFKKEYAIYIYHGQCHYLYFTNYYHHNTDEIELLWSYKKDCIKDTSFNFIEDSNNIKNHPNLGDSFCRYRLVNDSVLKVEYNFPKWVKSVNTRTKDSIFPKYFYLKK